MLGATHVSTGVLTGVLTVPLVTGPIGIVDPGWGTLGWVAVCGGAAYLPDWDQPGSTVSRMWGPVSNSIAHGISAVAQGHRNGTHDLLIGPTAFALLTAVLTFHGLGINPRDVDLTGGPLTDAAQVAAALVWLTPAFVVAVTVGMMFRAYGAVIPGRMGTTAVGNGLLSAGLAAAYLTAFGDTPGWLPVAVWLGCVTHILGDALTRSGVPVPVAWITTDARVSVWGFTTGGAVEKYLVAPAVTVATFVAVLWVSGLLDDASAAVTLVKRT